MTSLPTRGEVFSKIIHHLGEAQSAAATLSHLHNTEDAAKDKLLARGWFGVSEFLKEVQKRVTLLAQGRYQ